MMKRIITILFVLVAMVSCTKDNPKDRTVKARSGGYFNTEISATEIEAQGGTLLVKVISNVKWTVSADDFLKIDRVLGEGDGIVSVQVPENYSFDRKECILSLSTEAEIDVDGPEGSVFGKTDSYTISQDAAEVVFRVDTTAIKVAAPVTTAKITLFENVGYEVVCESDSLGCKVVNTGDFVHELRFTFPINDGESKRVYKAHINPLRDDLELSPIVLTITHNANSTIILDCTDASNFRYMKDSTIVSLPTTTHNKDFVTCDFWLKDHPEYIFSGSVKNWANTLDAALNSPVRMPRIEGYQLSIVSITLSYASATRTYHITDGKTILGTTTANKTLQGKIEVDQSKAEGDERYLVCTGEMCCKFILTYVSVE